MDVDMDILFVLFVLLVSLLLFSIFLIIYLGCNLIDWYMDTDKGITLHDIMIEDKKRWIKFAKTVKKMRIK